MKKSNSYVIKYRALRLLTFLSMAFIALVVVDGQAVADPLVETTEVLFKGTNIEQKATELKSPVAIYEFVRNTHEYALYHGSRSNSLNTFGGYRGSDVDIASVLIAMYRSQGIPARYASGNARIAATEVANWLGVKDTQLAQAIMNDQGIQGVVFNAETTTIDFEHVWVQVQVPYDNYRGINASGINCATTPARCQWINVDASFKLRQYHNQNIDVYNNLSFEYTQYYNALKDNLADFRDKGPLEIYEKQILDRLKTTASGKNLEDVADVGTIIQTRDGLLPASLPYHVISAIQSYDSVKDHDALAGVKKWAKYVDIKIVDVSAIDVETGELTTGSFDIGKFALANLSTERLTLKYEKIDEFNGRIVTNQATGQTLYFGDKVIHSQNGHQFKVQLDGTFTLQGSMDGAPATTPNTQDDTINVTYNNLSTKGYHLIATGGYTSNWTQVHRAAAQLLAANDTYKIIFNPADPGLNTQNPCNLKTGLNCTPYVDTNNNGWDATDTKLLDHPANDELTGGLLHTAANLYFTRLAEQSRRLESLNHVIAPIVGYLGVVSSTNEVDYLGNTAFSVMPGGLLIDIKGITVNGNWRIDAPATSASEHFKLLGHIASSLEHEIWQELIGFDAVSTVRGIQIALAQGANGKQNNLGQRYLGDG